MSNLGEETIFNLLPREEVKAEKPPRYRSLFDPKSPVPYSTFKNTGGGVYGKRDGGSHKPDVYLKRGTGSAGGPSHTVRSTPEKRPERGEDLRKAAVPLAKERPVMGVKADKNFITANAVNAILAVPKTRTPPTIDYLAKEDYGKVPAYLGQIKEEVEPMPEDERLELLDALKSKWDAVNARYQKLCHQTFFERGRLEQKKSLEKMLDAIEADIEKIGKGPIMVKK
ncbi:hypothetical protein JKP88DRAFT_249526 [Tribonema minus]|uniref:Enkurin domain-containing protein n=1 Tax=Tribonema minus TaxID=303371 RepID=A0A835YSE5_9STRA|nr:hypothetical protein JKP88DRAFT_249526 [Tribonema minus]